MDGRTEAIALPPTLMRSVMNGCMNGEHTFTATFALSTRAKAVVISVTASPDERLALSRLRVEVPSSERRRARSTVRYQLTVL